jgi:hypothetical protein
MKSVIDVIYEMGEGNQRVASSYSNYQGTPDPPKKHFTIGQEIQVFEPKLGDFIFGVIKGINVYANPPTYWVTSSDKRTEWKGKNFTRVYNTLDIEDLYHGDLYCG